MKNIKYIFSAVLLAGTLTVMAEDNATCRDFLPEKGNWTLAATVGYIDYASITAQPGNLLNYSAEAPTINWMEKGLALGVEGGFFFHDMWKLSFGGGLHFSANPGHYGIPGTVEGVEGEIWNEDNYGNIPNYLDVTTSDKFAYNVYAGVDRYFHLKKVPNMALFCGLKVGFAYAMNEQKLDDYYWLGKSIADNWNLRGAINLGADYYFLPAMWVGISFEFVNYAYNMVTYKPQPGLNALRADSSNLGFLANPTLKIGFKF